MREHRLARSAAIAIALAQVLWVAATCDPAPAESRVPDRQSGLASRANGCGQVTGGTFAHGRSVDTFTQFSYYVFAVGTTCSQAHSVARGWGSATNIDGGAPLNAQVQSFACTRSSFTQVTPLARCSSGSAVVTIYRAPPVPLISDFANFDNRPTLITQGASNSLYELRWNSWGGPVANAIGRASEGVTGHYHTYRLALQAYALGRCHGLRVYTRLRLRDLDAHRTQVETLNCRVGQYF